MALQLAVRVEREQPPTVAQAAAAAALATVALLDDPRSGPDGPWHEAVERWNGARIRKIVRRGRGSAWRKVQEVDGVTVTVDGVEARAFVPSPIDEVPRAVGKLQIQSGPLEGPERVASIEPRPGPGLLIAVTPEVDMTWGKQSAQCAHAAHRAWQRAGAERRRWWSEAGRPVVIVHPEPPLWAALADGADVEINDGGFTEIPAGTRTTVARWIESA